MNHLLHVLKGMVMLVLVAIPAIVADPSVAHYVAQHPAVDTYVALALGVVNALRAAAGSTATT